MSTADVDTAIAVAYAAADLVFDQVEVVATPGSAALVLAIAGDDTNARAVLGELKVGEMLRLAAAARAVAEACDALRESVRSCRGCGCTDAAACAGGCSWVGPDLCSGCREPAP